MYTEMVGWIFCEDGEDTYPVRRWGVPEWREWAGALFPEELPALGIPEVAMSGGWNIPQWEAWAEGLATEQLWWLAIEYMRRTIYGMEPCVIVGVSEPVDVGMSDADLSELLADIDLSL